MRLGIARSNGEVDTYDICTNGVELSPFLSTLIEKNDSDHEEEEEENPIHLPVTFEDKYMKIVENYLNYFSRESLPLKIATPINSSNSNDILHPRIYEWLQDFSFNQLATFRQICMYFELDPLIEQIDGILAISIVKNPKEVFKEFHEPNLTLASKDSVTEEFPILH